jgi:hypothetical protein
MQAVQRTASRVLPYPKESTERENRVKGGLYRVVPLSGLWETTIA